MSDGGNVAIKMMSLESFQGFIESIVTISNNISDGWKLISKPEETENHKYILKKQIVQLKNPEDENEEIIAHFEYHVAFGISYGVPVLCFNIWKSNGTMITLEEYWKCNTRFKEYSMYETLTQMDHPVLHQPVYTLHPCRTQEILEPFMEKSKNPIISWLSVVGPYVQLELLEDYLKSC
ncbi:ubiquitin-like-conjugating enzyme ATG10 isoform X1 [Diabrotica virgifera virgifera]|uniref:Ubiquitin-like-conjugating enzyme ATG10 n=2 Tax=Diabrotica virgifera virgifera TaxID=50390 RepID=A0ABM5KRS9_DIAVI|nr:ubiquitin-like-conjugating enzyme ATG10 isoform X1 [Diabrotica virgifera virgifera]